MINVEIFSCAGGMAEGFRRAGITFDMAVDMAPDHCDSYEANLGHRPLQMNALDLLRMAKLGWHVEVDLLVADPPCTPWSRAGKRKGLTDERDMLRATAEIIALLRPRAYLIGNVPGLEDSQNLPIVQDVIGGLARYGYCVRDFASLDAADYGVPQHRVRPFWYGHRFGPCLRWPEPTHGDPDELQETLPGVRSLVPWVTCGQALAHLPAKELGRPIKLRRRDCHGKRHGSVLQLPARVVGTSNLSDGNVLLPDAANGHQPHAADSPARTITSSSGRGAPGALVFSDNHRPSFADEPAMTVRAGDGGGAVRAMSFRSRGEVTYNARHAPATEDAPAPTIGAKMRHQAGQVLQLRKKTPQSARTVAPDAPATAVQVREDRVGSGMVIEWPWARPSTTLQADPRIPPPGTNGRKKGTKNGRTRPGAVLLSEKAAKILQGFPDDWVVAGKTKRTRWSQIGQAMPPPLAHAVALSVRQQLEASAGDQPLEAFVPYSPPPTRAAAREPEQVAMNLGGMP